MTIPVVPDGAKLITFESLLKLKNNTGKYLTYNSVDGFGSEETNFHASIENLKRNHFLPNQYYYVFAHGSNHSILWLNVYPPLDDKQIAINKKLTRIQYISIKNIKSETKRKVIINRFYEYIKDRGYTDNQTLVLVSCNVGNGTAKPIGHYISEHPNIGTVYAPTSITWYSKTPNIFSCARWKKKGEKDTPVRSLSGKFRIFNSASIK